MNRCGRGRCRSRRFVTRELSKALTELSADDDAALHDAARRLDAHAVRWEAEQCVRLEEQTGHGPTRTGALQPKR